MQPHGPLSFKISPTFPFEQRCRKREGSSPSRTMGLSHSFPLLVPRPTFPFTGTEPGSPAEKGHLAGRLRECKEALVFLVGVSDGKGTLKDIGVTLTWYFRGPCPVLSASHDLAPSVPIERPGRQYDRLYFTDKETEARREEITGSTACRRQSWDLNPRRPPAEPNRHQWVSKVVGHVWVF